MEFFLPLDVEVTVDIIYDVVECIDMNRIVAFFACVMNWNSMLLDF